jgi:hypothetical protein
MGYDLYWVEREPEPDDGAPIEEWMARTSTRTSGVWRGSGRRWT